jgi:hypothetical protein
MRTVTTFILTLISLTSLAQSNKWTDFERTWDKYVGQPTHENAVKVYEQLPDEPLGKDLPDERLTNKIFENWDQISKRIITGDKDAIRIGFRLFTIADGAFQDGLGIDLGKLITTNPKLFLQELKNNRHFIVSLDGLVGNYGEKYVDEKELQLKETEKRIKSLEKVNDSGLVNTKAECLKELTDKKNRLVN